MAEITQKQSISQSLRQEQSMTQRQIQALELLFLPVMELQAAINSELEKNPVLDIEEPPELDAREQAMDDDQWLEHILKLEDESRYVRSRGPRVTPEDEERRQHFLDSAVAEMSFQERLLQQLRFLDLAPELFARCEVVISGLDDKGYLSSHPDDLAMVAGCSRAAINEAVKVVQGLEPPGVAAANLRERLMLQLERKGMGGTLVFRAVEGHLEDIAANRLPQVAKAMAVPIGKLKELIAEIQNLAPHINIGEVSPHDYVNEEIEIIEDSSGTPQARIINDHLPNLHISKQYRDLLADPATPAEARNYIKEKVRSGVFLINSIIQRQTTIRKIAQQLVASQVEYFIHGADRLKPLTMAQVAEAIGVHETTVSRAVAGKYIRCKFGIMPIKSFFSTGYATESGESVSRNVVQDEIRAMIEDENPAAPLSDSQIVEKLNAIGLKVARRTVAKYREMMDILPSNLRRQY